MAAVLGPVSEDNVFYLGSLDGKESRILFHGSSPMAYAMGYMLYLADGVLMARQFDPGKLDFLGESTPGSTPTFSPDAKSVVYDVITPNSGKIDLWLLDISAGNRTRLASDPLNFSFHSAVWSPDGTHLAYASARTGKRAIYIRSVNQITPEEERWEEQEDANAYPTDWTPDGKSLILTERPISTHDQRISLLSVAGKNGAEPLLEIKGTNVDSGKVSRDGRWIAYRSDESGRSEV